MYKVNLLGEGMSSDIFISDLDTKKPKSSLKLILSLIIGLVVIGIGALYFQQSKPAIVFLLLSHVVRLSPQRRGVPM